MKIKIRVWNGEQMISPDYITRSGVAHWKENSIPESSSETMLFIGLFDREGEEIYEGDIVDIGQTVNGQSEFLIKSILPYPILKYAFDMDRDYEYDPIDFFRGCEEEFKIIGNIHENLLK